MKRWLPHTDISATFLQPLLSRGLELLQTMG